MNRRGLLKFLGLSGAATAIATVQAVTAEASIAKPSATILAALPPLADGDHEFDAEDLRLLEELATSQRQEVLVCDHLTTVGWNGFLFNLKPGWNTIPCQIAAVYQESLYQNLRSAGIGLSQEFPDYVPTSGGAPYPITAEYPGIGGTYG